ncbi:GDP-mannose 4,6-dehydratase [Clostridium aestuarii]|uniref:GDP-mannose 4,6-dehydratase n=1 Tax=Clostridium aestuarii TaxID=338193 RepID=A0ABT4CUS5_9CLOT|nr:NAD-dependent epimerase/dehydratase family protein [Clostridium aestuarii]MCY6482749.1 GDP-mannose 4,6-dehydratase [Clostridium aestuarii]
MNKKILITGASGFVGSCLAESLVNEGYDVNLIVRSTSNLWRLQKIRNDVKIYYVDLYDEYKLNKIIKVINPEYIFHLATYGGYPFQHEISKIISTNINGTINLINACKNIDYKSFINIGSSSEYGLKENPMRECNLLEPINLYGITKSTATLYCNMIAKTQKKPINTIRLFSVYGYYEDKKRLVPSVILSCLKGEDPKLACGDTVRDFIFVEDVVELLKYIAFDIKTQGKIYNAGYGKQHTVREMVQTIISQCNPNLQPVWNVFKSNRSDTDRWESDMSLVKKELSWIPKYNLKEGILKDIEWFKNNINLYLRKC